MYAFFWCYICCVYTEVFYPPIKECRLNQGELWIKSYIKNSRSAVDYFDFHDISLASTLMLTINLGNCSIVKVLSVISSALGRMSWDFYSPKCNNLARDLFGWKLMFFPWIVVTVTCSSPIIFYENHLFLYTSRFGSTPVPFWEFVVIFSVPLISYTLISFSFHLN